MKIKIYLALLLFVGISGLSFGQTMVTPETFAAVYGAATDGEILYLGSGTYSEKVALPAYGVAVTLMPQEGEEPIVAMQFATPTGDNGGTLIFDGIAIDAKKGRDHFIYRPRAMQGLIFKNCSFRGYTRCFLYDNYKDKVIERLEFDNCVLDGSDATSYGFMYTKGLIKHFSVKNSTLFNYKSEGLMMVTGDTNDAELEVSFEFSNNTVYNFTGGEFKFIESKATTNDASNYTYRDNIFYYTPAITNQLLAIKTGTATGTHNLIEGWSADVPWDSSNDKSFSSLGLSESPFLDAANGDFSFTSSSPLAKASSTGGVIGDPEWLTEVVPEEVEVVLGVKEEGQGTIDKSTGNYVLGSTQTVTATASEGYDFVNWVDAAGTELTTDNPYAFIVAEGVTIYAVFKEAEPELKLMMTRYEGESFSESQGARAEANASLSGGGNVGYITNGTWIKFSNFTFTEHDLRIDFVASGTSGGQVEYRLDAVDGTLIATAAVAPTAGWTDFKVNSAAISNVTGTHDLYLLFSGGSGYLFNLDYFEIGTYNPDAEFYTLTTNATPSEAGLVKQSALGTEFSSGTEVTLTAEDNFGYDFVQWVDENGTSISTNKSLTLVMDSNITRIAEFKAVSTFKLTLNLDGANGMGTVTISPAGKDGLYEEYEANTSITVTAVENEVIKFSNWDDGSTSLMKSFGITSNTNLTANFSSVSYIAGWTFPEDGYLSVLSANLYSNNENRPELFSYYVSDDRLGDNMRIQERSGKRGISCQWGTNDFTYFKTSMSTVGYENIQIKSAFLGRYSGADEWYLQYSLDNENFTTLQTVTINTSSYTNLNAILPAEAQGKSKVYIRWYPNVNGTIHDPGQYVATIMADVYFTADEAFEADETAPVLLSTVPTEGANTASASGSIILNFDEKVQAGSGNATINSVTLTPEFGGKTVKFKYYGLDYNTTYTFALPKGAIADLSGNEAEAVSINFTTIDKPIPTKRGFDFIVDADATDEQVATGTYGRTIKSAFDAAPSNQASRFLVYIANGTYNMGSEAWTSGDKTVMILEEGKNNVSLIAQSKDSVILQGNPEWGIKNAVLRINANDTYMENVTIQHLDGMTTNGQRPALSSNGDRNVYNGIKLMSKQDTQVTGGKRSFYYQSEIQGDVDYICGGGTHWYEQCDLVFVGGGYLVAPSTAADVDYGYVFNKSTIKGVSGYYLGRPWQNAPRAVFLNTTMEAEPHTVGWASMGVLPAIFAEYNSVNASGAAVNTANRTNVFTVNDASVTGNYNPVLTAEEASSYTIENALAGDDIWNPLLIIDQLDAPENVQVSATSPLPIDNSAASITWKENPYAICYLITRNGKLLSITQEATIAQEIGLAEAHYDYTIQSVNEYGGLSEKVDVRITVGDPVDVPAITYINSVTGAQIFGLAPSEYTQGQVTTLPTSVTFNGYTFYGWSESANEPNNITEIDASARGAKTYYAFFGENGNNEPNPAKVYTISYVNAITGELIVEEAWLKEYEERTSFTLPTSTIYEGYTFYGWSLSSSTPDKLTIIPTTVSGNLVFYAFFGENGNNKADGTASTKNAITYRNAITGNIIEGMSLTEYTEGELVMLPATAPIYDGYTFYGWSLSADMPNKLNYLSSSTTGDVVLYAYWGENGNNRPDVEFVVSKITYINSITGETIKGLNPSSYNEGYVMNLPENVNYAGYTFYGWSASAAMPGTQTFIPVTATGEQKFYAFFGESGNNVPDEVLSYFITFANLPDGYALDSSVEVSVGESYVLPEGKAAGYRFLGWYLSVDYDQEVKMFDGKQEGDVTVYGRWKKLANFAIYPTVSSTRINIESDQAIGVIHLFNSKGVLVKLLNIDATASVMDISSLPAGIYFVKNTDGTTVKIMKQ
ncbi:MAG: pectinesterase family protein [Mangrovibacterium sp.]